ncbi:sensor histidine kinase [Methanoregula sp. UBA64]|jgi:PAS domain S-box-containing protein|uniref:sensor histidine kinase n=1 Tax=Methanoregula sp. UBA64 TaxID=1915554 RepID=UPI0025E5FA3A|nr:PAS domain-containing sensor histidine kinase [Methanoregula sp. UBA64]
MDAEARQTPFDQRLFLIFMVTFAGMTTFEFAAQYLYPYPPDWRSNLVTSFFTSGLAVIIAYFPLNAYYRQSERLLAEREKNRAVEMELRKNEEKFRMVIENTLDGIVVAALNGDVLYSNQANAQIFDIERGEYEPGSKNALDFLHPAHRDRARQNFCRSAESDGEDPREYLAVTATGRPIWIEVVGKRWVYRDVPVLILSVKDITGRKQMEQAVLHANKKLTLLSRITRHDISNQLQVLDNYTELIRTTDLLPEYRAYFSRIHDATSRITSMIRFTQEYEDVGISSAVWQNLPALVASAANGITLGNITLENDLPADAEIFADPLVVKVFFNLIDNAVRHGGRIRTIRFFLSGRGTGRVIVCADDGDGIAPDEKERIFARGFGKNTGFGLALSREILDITGITIKETGGPGAGAQFELAVPEDAWRTAGPAPATH